MDTGTVFALFYAILFGGTLNRLLVWSAFWASTAEEKNEHGRRWRRRREHSLLAFTVAPAAYFSVVLHYFGQMAIPPSLPGKALWAIAIFLSVLFLNACYRYWVAIVMRKGIDPLSDDAPLSRLREFGWENYIEGARFALAQALVGLTILFMMRYAWPLLVNKVCQP